MHMIATAINNFGRIRILIPITAPVIITLRVVTTGLTVERTGTRTFVRIDRSWYGNRRGRGGDRSWWGGGGRYRQVIGSNIHATDIDGTILRIQTTIPISSTIVAITVPLNIAGIIKGDPIWIIFVTTTGGRTRRIRRRRIAVAIDGPVAIVRTRGARRTVENPTTTLCVRLGLIPGTGLFDLDLDGTDNDRIRNRSRIVLLWWY